MSISVRIQDVSKRYRLGEVGTGTLARDLERVWSRMLGRPDPTATIGDANERTVAGGEYVWALRDVSFDIIEGEVVGLIGRNGAGKSTLLKLLARVTAPTTGKIQVRGRIASLLEVGTGFHPELTGRENIFLSGAIMGMTQQETTNRLDQIVAFSGCEKYLDTPIKRYSSGMIVRLGFSVAAHLECEILVVDEVLAVGDAEFQLKCVQKMRDVSRNGRTVIVVSHNLRTITSLCSSAVLLNNGTVCATGPTDEVTSKYLFQFNPETVNDVSSVAGRQGCGRLRFLRFSWLNDEGLPILQPRAGDRLAIRVDYAIIDPALNGRNLHLGVSFHDHLGGMKFAMNTTVSGANFICHGDGHVDFKLKWPLGSGEYKISLFSHVDGETMDWLDESLNLKFRSEDGDFFGTGAVPAPGSGPVYVPFDCEFSTPLPGN